MPVDPSLSPGAAGLGADFGTVGPEWRIGGIEGLSPDGTPAKKPAAAGGTGFDDMLANQVGKLSDLQTEGANASASLADGTATDVSSVVMAVERARLSMQLAAQIRNRAVEAYQEVFRTQV